MTRSTASAPIVRTHVSADNWREVRAHWAVVCNIYGWEGKVRSFLEVGMAEFFGGEVDEEFCATRVADLIIETFQLARVEGIDLWK